MLGHYTTAPSVIVCLTSFTSGLTHVANNTRESLPCQHPIESYLLEPAATRIGYCVLAAHIQMVLLWRTGSNYLTSAPTLSLGMVSAMHEQPGSFSSSSSCFKSRYNYGPADQNFGDLYYPQPSDTQQAAPVVVLLHGGFWRAAYGLDLMVAMAEALAARGLAVWNVEYRRAGDPGGGWPNTLLDVAQAVEYLHTLSSEFELDLYRVIPVGHSAGGHLALWLAGQHRLPATSPLLTPPPHISFQGAISLAGAVDLEQTWQLNLGKGAAANFLGGSPSDYPKRYAQASPAALLPLELPQVLIHGTDDVNVPLIISQHYAQKARAAGDKVKLVTLSDVDHFAIIDPQTAAGTHVLQEILQMTQLPPAP